MMKKWIALLLVAVLALGLVACGGNGEGGTTVAPGTTEAGTTGAGVPAPDAPKTTLRVGGMTGPTTMGMVKLIQDGKAGKTQNDYAFTIKGNADGITPLLMQGELDMAALPANAAAVLYNRKPDTFQILAVNTLGVLYLLEKGEAITEWEDLAGKTIYATGKGQTPEFNLRYLLEENGLDPDEDVNLVFKSEPKEILPILKQTEGAVAMLPQPFVTAAMGQVPGLRIAMDLTAEWDALDNGSAMVTGVMVARKDFVAAHPEEVATFLAEYEASINYVKTHVEEMAPLIKEYIGVEEAVAKVAVPKCNLQFLSGAEMKAAVSGYLAVLYAQEPNSVGGAVPGNDFYYDVAQK